MKLVNTKTFFLILLLSLGVNAQVPATQYANKIAYISGGVGTEESTAIEMESKQWPLMLQFSQINEKGWGAWISGVQVKIINGDKQEIFSAICDGPMMLINLVPGQYEVISIYEGRAQTLPAVIQAKKPQKLSIFWK
jgi:hypothetical protein